MSSPTSYPRLRRKNPGSVTIFETAFKKEGSKDLEFSSLEKLARFMGRGPLKRRNKRKAPLISRARCEGRRKKANLKGPLLCLMDVDKVSLSAEECHRRLDFMGVSHYLHTTWSHDPQDTLRHSYRVYLDVLAEGRDECRDVATQAFKIIGLPRNKDSWNAIGLFSPAVHPNREDQYREFSSFFGDQSWTFKRTSEGKSQVTKKRKFTLTPPRDVDVEELKEALKSIPNADREVWLTMGMALRDSGLAEGREIWDDWSLSQEYPKYSDSAQDTAWDSFDDAPEDDSVERITIKSVFSKAMEEGWRPPKATALEDFENVLDPLQMHLKSMNKKYAYVWLGNGAVATLGKSNQPVDFRSTQGFLKMFQHPTYVTGRRPRGGGQIENSIGKIWLDLWPPRRSYMDVDFLPENSDEKLPKSTLNTWKGWKYEPKSTSVELFLNHVKEIICRGDDDHYRWIVAWMGHLVQRPNEKPGTAIVLRGDEGAGKGIFGNALVELCGVHGVHVTQASQLTGSFNRHLMGKLLIFADEVTWGGRKQEEGVLKALITEKHLMVEPKGVDAFMMRNFFRVIISSNNEWIIPAGLTARRFQVLDVGNSKIKDFDYFSDIADELKKDGYSGLMSYLGGLDLDEWPDPSRIIHTDALTHQKLQSLDSIDSWIMTVLDRGEVCEGVDGWPKSVNTTLFYDGYLESSRDRGENRRSVEILVGGRLKKIFGSEIRKRRKTEGGDRQYRWFLPELDRARELFEIYVSTTIDWSGSDRGFLE